MSHLTTSETRTGVAIEFSRTTTSMGELNFDFVAHKMTFIVLSNALLGGFATIEFLRIHFSARTSFKRNMSYHEAIADPIPMLASRTQPVTRTHTSIQY